MEAIHFLVQLILQDRRKLQTRITTAGNIYFELNVPRNHKKVLMNLTKKKVPNNAYTCRVCILFDMTVRNFLCGTNLCVERKNGQYLNAIKGNYGNSKPRMQAVKIDNGALVMIFESSIDANNAQYKRNSMENKVYHFLHFFSQIKSFVTHNGCNFCRVAKRKLCENLQSRICPRFQNVTCQV